MTEPTSTDAVPATSAPSYVYRATLLRVKDGDTLVANVDLGFYASIAVTVRIAGVDTPELHSHDPEQRRLAGLARDFLQGLLAEPFLLASHKDQRSFERWVCDVWLPDGSRCADVIADAGHGVVVP